MRYLPARLRGFLSTGMELAVNIMLRKKNMDKPYNRCLHCEYFGNGCDGPRTSSMSLERWCEWLRDVKDIQKLTNAQIAEAANVSVATVDRVMSGSLAKDIMRSTSTAIENATIGSNGQYPCYLAFLDEMPEETRTVKKLQEELAQLRANIGRAHDFQEKVINNVREDAEKRIEELKDKYEKEVAYLKKQVESLLGDNNRLREQMDRKDDYIDRLAKKAGI